MAKILKTARQIEAQLNDAVRRHVGCQGITVQRIQAIEHANGPANWDAEFAPPPNGSISPDCKRTLISAKHAFQQKIDLIDEA